MTKTLKKRVYSEKELVDKIIELSEQYPNETITKQFYEQKVRSPSAKVIVERLGWNRAIRRAGLRPNKFLNLQELLDEFDKTINELGYIPSSVEYQQKRMKPNFKTINRLGFTWQEFLDEYEQYKKGKK
jgi:hypothetical protein